MTGGFLLQTVESCFLGDARRLKAWVPTHWPQQRLIGRLSPPVSAAPPGGQCQWGLLYQGSGGRQAMPHRGFNWFSGSSSLRPCEMSSLQYLDTPFPGKKQVTGWLIS